MPAAVGSQVEGVPQCGAAGDTTENETVFGCVLVDGVSDRGAAAPAADLPGGSAKEPVDTDQVDSGKPSLATSDLTETMMDLIRIILAILLPPLGVFLQVGFGGAPGEVRVDRRQSQHRRR